MMKNFKRLAAIGLAATMLVGNGVMALADGNEQSTTGSGKYEGYVDETSAFSVVVPTAAANQFDFFIDPNNLLSSTGYARIGGGVSAADFDSGSSLYFTRDTSSGAEFDGGKKYGKDSQKITLTNKSSYTVNVEVSATVTGATGIDFSETDVMSGVTNPTLYLAIVSGSTTKAISATAGGKLDGTIAGEPDNFEVKWDSTANSNAGGYVFGEVDSVDPSTWKTLDFHLTGACGGTWTEAQATFAPSISLTWKVTDPKAVPTEVSITSGATAVTPGSADAQAGVTHTAALTSGSDTEITIGLPDGNTIKKVYVAGSIASLSNNTENAARASISGNKVVIKGDSDWATGGAGVKYAKIVVGTSSGTTATYIIKIVVS